METLKTIETIIELIITVSGAVFALWIFLRDKRRDAIKLLAKQVFAYNSLEQELLKELNAKTGTPVQTLQKDLRQKTLDKVDEVTSFMTPSKAKSDISAL